MKSALYYPEWSLNDPVALGEFLIYWDTLTFMTPLSEWDFPIGGYDREIDNALYEAHKMYALPYKPSKKERKQCDALVKNVFYEHNESFKRYSNVMSRMSHVTLDARKFASETITFLEENQILEKATENVCHISEASANIVMAAMAHCCSSEGLPAVTVDDKQYKLHLHLINDALEPKQNVEDNPIDEEVTPLSIIHCKLRLPKAERNDPRFLKYVLTARKKDEVNGYRIKFQEKINDYCKSLTSVKAEAELLNIQNHFEKELEKDRKNLIRELRNAGCEAVISKDGIISLAAGFLAGAATAGLGAALGPIGCLWTYRKRRKEVMRNNWTSWLYQLKHPHFSIW